MADKDLRKAQLGLLRFEKAMKKTAEARKRTGVLNKAPLLAMFGTVAASAAMASQKLGSGEPLAHAGAIEKALLNEATADSWLMDLAEVVSKAHAAVEGMAVQGAFVLLRADGGTPKEDPPQVIASLLGLG